MTTFERFVGVAGGVTVLTLIVIGQGALIVPAFTPFMLALTGSWWWRAKRGK